MSIMFFLRGIIFGFSMAVPVGPICLLCINRTLANGLAHGIASGVGAASIDLVYGLIAALGLTVISDFLISYQNLFRIIGGLFLFYLGFKIFLSKPGSISSNIPKSSLWSDFTTTFFLTLINPMTILCYVTVFAGVGLNFGLLGWFEGIVFALGVFTGAVLFYLMLCSIVAFFRKSLGDSGLVVVNKISGGLIITFSFWMFLEFIFYFF